MEPQPSIVRNALGEEVKVLDVPSVAVPYRERRDLYPSGETPDEVEAAKFGKFKSRRYSPRGDGDPGLMIDSDGEVNGEDEVADEVPVASETAEPQGKV